MDKPRQSPEQSDHPLSDDDLRIVVRELNKSIAYLSKMVLQLQRSVNADKKDQPITSTRGNGSTPTVH